MSDAGGLPELAVRLETLGTLPVAEHPDLLEAVHRAVVGELEALGSGKGLAGSQAGPTAPGADPDQ